MSPLTKAQVFEQLNKVLIFPASDKRFTVHLIDLNGNNFAPESHAYKISYTCSVLGERNNITFYPQTVGIQGATKLKGVLLK